MFTASYGSESTCTAECMYVCVRVTITTMPLSISSTKPLQQTSLPQYACVHRTLSVQIVRFFSSCPLLWLSSLINFLLLVLWCTIQHWRIHRNDECASGVGREVVKRQKLLRKDIVYGGKKTQYRCRKHPLKTQKILYNSCQRKRQTPTRIHWYRA